MNNLIKSILKTAVYFLDQTDRLGSDVRDRVSDGWDRATDRVSDLRDQAQDMFAPENHALKSTLMFVAGVGVGIGAAMLFAPASGEEIRSQIGEKVQDISGRVRSRFSGAPSSSTSATGTEGV